MLQEYRTGQSHLRLPAARPEQHPEVPRQRGGKVFSQKPP